MFGLYKHWVLMKYESFHIVEDLPKFEIPGGLCEACILGEHQESLLKERHVSQTLVVVHSYICGPMTTQSLGEAK